MTARFKCSQKNEQKPEVCTAWYDRRWKCHLEVSKLRHFAQIAKTTPSKQIKHKFV